MNAEEVAASRDRVLAWMEEGDSPMTGARASKILDAVSAEPSDLEALSEAVGDYVRACTAAVPSGGDRIAALEDARSRISLCCGVAQGWAITVQSDQTVVALFGEFKDLVTNADTSDLEAPYQRTFSVLLNAIEARAQDPTITVEDLAQLATSYWTLFDAMKPYWGNQAFDGDAPAVDPNPGDD